MNPLKTLLNKVFETPPPQNTPKAPGEEAAFEWNPDEAVAPTSARAASWKRGDANEETPTVVPSVTPLPERPAVLAAPPEVPSTITATAAPAAIEPSPAPVAQALPAPTSPPPVPLSDFEDVYRKAGIKSPVHGYGVERVYRLLTSRRLVGLDRSIRRSALLTALDAAGVPASDVSQDAVLRRKALTAYEAEKALELQSLRSRNESRVEALQDTVETFTRQKQSQIERLAQGSTSAVRAQSDLEIRKRMEQDRLYRSLAYFVEPLPSPSAEMRSASEPARALPRGIQRFDATIGMGEPVPEEAPLLATEAVTPQSRSAKPEEVEVTTVRPDQEVGPDTRPVATSGLEMALRAAAEDARAAGWGQTAIVEGSTPDTVEALRKLREAAKTESES